MQHDHGIDIVAPLAHWPRVTLEETLGPGRSHARLLPRSRTPAGATAWAGLETAASPSWPRWPTGPG